MAEALGTLQYVATALISDNSSFYAWHNSVISSKILAKTLLSGKEAAAYAVRHLEGLG